MGGHYAFTLRILGERADEWQRAVGVSTFPTIDFFPVPALLPGLGLRLVHRLDVDKMRRETPELLQQVVEYLSRKFHLTPDEAQTELNTTGLPVLADDCIVSVHLPISRKAFEDFVHDDDNPDPEDSDY
jgi:hypothetical protein